MVLNPSPALIFHIDVFMGSAGLNKKKKTISKLRYERRKWNSERRKLDCLCTISVDEAWMIRRYLLIIHDYSAGVSGLFMHDIDIYGRFMNDAFWIFLNNL